MGAKVSFVTPEASGKRQGPTGGCQPPLGGAERRLDIHVFVHEDGRIEAGRAWERCVWRDRHVLIAESPAPHLTTNMEATLRAMAMQWVADRGWRGMVTLGFALDDESGLFHLIETPLHSVIEPGVFAEPIAAHVLEVRIGFGLAAERSGMHLLVWGMTRGEALRRAYQAIGDMHGVVVPDRAFLLNRLASPAFCRGLTGSRLARITD